MKYCFFALICLLSACSQPPANSSQIKTHEFIDLSKRAKPPSITQNPWQEVVINVTDLSHATNFFVGIGDFEFALYSSAIASIFIGLIVFAI